MINISVHKISDGYCVNVNRESEDFSIEKVSVEGEFCSALEANSSQSSKQEVPDLLGDFECVGNSDSLIAISKEPKEKPSEDVSPHKINPLDQKLKEEGNVAKAFEGDLIVLESTPPSSDQLAEDLPKNDQNEKSNLNATSSETRDNSAEHSQSSQTKAVDSLRSSYKFLNRPRIINKVNSSECKPPQAQSNDKPEHIDEAFTIPSFVENLVEGETMNIEIFDPLDPDQFQYMIRFDYFKIIGMTKEFSREITKRKPNKCPTVKQGNLIYVRCKDQKFYRARVARILNDGKLRVIMLDTGLIEDVSEWYFLDGYSCRVPLLSAMIRSIENVPENVRNQVSAKICKLRQTLCLKVSVVSVTKSRVVIDAYIGDSEKVSLFLLPPRLFAYDSLLLWEQKLKDEGKSEKLINLEVKNEKDSQKENNKVKKNEKMENPIQNNLLKDDSSFDPRPELSKNLRSTLTYEKLPANKGVVTYQEPSHPSIIFILGNGEKALDVLDRSVEARPYLAEFENPQVGSLALMEKDDDEKLDFIRVAIQAILPDRNYSVYCIDFGMTDNVSGSKLLALPKVIGIEKIPAQGIKCIVDNYHKVPDFSRQIDKVFNELALISYKTLAFLGEGTYRIEFTGLVDAEGKPYEDWTCGKIYPPE